MSNLKITVPNMGDFKDIEVIEVLVKDGQTINKNDSIITLESDKSSVEVPSTHSGKIKKVNVSVGDKINKGDLILTLESKQETNEPIKEKSKKESVKPKKQNEVVQVQQQQPAPSVPASGKSSASPKIRKFARELGADISKISGTQRAGRVSAEDIKNFIRSQVTVSQGEVQKKEVTKYVEEYSHEEFGEIATQDLPRVKKLSGPHLVRSWTEIPHVTQHDENRCY